MSADIYKNLHECGVFEYGSNELLLHEKNLTKYFEREYRRRARNSNKAVDIGEGDIALAAKDLADKHYDEGLEFFESFLDADTMSYTMAYYGEEPGEIIASKLSLCQAQINKFDLISKRIQLSGDEVVLNIGCGFGFFESYLINRFPCIQITSTTHSRDQYNFILDRKNNSKDPLSSNRFRIIFGEIDSNSIDHFGENKYDVICSLGLIEQINNIEIFFSILFKALKKDGRMFHHLIVSRDLIPQLLDPSMTLIGDYFPGGKILPYDALKRDVEGFELTNSWFVNGMNYWRTLDAWHANFWKNIHNIYPELIDVKRLKYWNEYFIICKAMFYPDEGKAYGNGQYLYVKKA